ncbi:MAG: N-6 DNA methylase [Deltaproteobacteria bacterium]|nr:N-6 DNA methylase [Deltaproteobacteria bacterium]MBW2032454.1 N-6 DNA methylase [Deltaproteobacteria bacterium]MBW2114120.1 N-6 DNA methylase [Deltaproteobacteria bacterium]
MTTATRILELVDRFHENLDAYKHGTYNETQVRREFIDPFFEELGWDIANKKGYAEAYKEVVHEDVVKVGGATKAPDYSFRIGGIRKFFLEAKKPSINIKDDTHPAYQLRRYAWSAKLPLSILTDFEEFAVYDCRVKPGKTDKSANARILYLTYTQYPELWEEIEGIFSRKAILKGSFDKYVESKKKKRGTAEVDTAFLQEIERWRDLLARNIALRNPDLSQRELNFAVQRTIDRIIFLRICEDRGIETYGRLMALQNGDKVYKRLFQLFRQADDRYNSGLFHFRPEKEQSSDVDALTPGLNIDDRILKDILKNLYYPDSPYEFSVLPADILGQVYEQFLGKVIRLTPSHRAIVEDKPEVRKAGGVYYTPTYIVDYIVKNTVGKLIEGKKPGPRGGVSKLKILDPACGSGSFLIGAYQFLLDWHLDQYVKDGPTKWARGKNPRLYQGPHGEWRLTTDERKRILLNNIYGVDIDPQAVEVTKLSLLLKVLEGEDEQTIGKQLLMFHGRVLPDLANNIKCGNSLIGPDFYKGQQMTLLDEEETYRINAFDWHSEFPEIMNPLNPPLEKENPPLPPFRKGGMGGFDAVIGNPPYGAFVDERQQLYYRSHFETCQSTGDSFVLFMEKASSLLNDTGFFGMIVQSAWVSAPSMKLFREFFSLRFKPVGFASMPYDVFGAYIDTVIVIAERAENDSALASVKKAPVNLVVFPLRHKIHSVGEFADYEKNADAAKWIKEDRNEFLITLSDIEQDITNKVTRIGGELSDVMDIQRGVTPFHTTPEKPNTNPYLAFRGTVRRYRINKGETVFIRYDETLAEFKPYRYFNGPRLLLREMISRQFQLQAVYTDEDFITNKSMQSLLLTEESYSIFYPLGIINSKLLSWYFLAIHSVGRRDDFPKIVLKQTRELPFRTIDFNDKTEKARHDQMIDLVEQMLTLHKKLAEAKIPQAKTVVQRQIETTDRQIDKLVYELYGLTQEEIELVEEGIA